MERIGEALGVAKSTIHEDLANCSTVEQLKPTKSDTNPKGAGRPMAPCPTGTGALGRRGHRPVAILRRGHPNSNL